MPTPASRASRPMVSLFAAGVMAGPVWSLDSGPESSMAHRGREALGQAPVAALLPAHRARALPGHALEGAPEGGLGVVAERRGDRGHRAARVAQQAPRLGHAPVRQV